MLCVRNFRYPELNCGVIPVGMGQAYRLAVEGSALLVPSVAELEAAGAPTGASPNGQEVPLFGCLQISRPGKEGGQPMLPLFVSRADAEAAVADAVTMTDGESADGLDIMRVGRSPRPLSYVGQKRKRTTRCRPLLPLLTCRSRRRLASPSVREQCVPLGLLAPRPSCPREALPFPHQWRSQPAPDLTCRRPVFCLAGASPSAGRWSYCSRPKGPDSSLWRLPRRSTLLTRRSGGRGGKRRIDQHGWGK